MCSLRKLLSRRLRPGGLEQAAEPAATAWPGSTWKRAGTEEFPALTAPPAELFSAATATAAMVSGSRGRARLLLPGPTQ
jgi:hypothetical protein